MRAFCIPKGPQRIVCLTEEPTEILYALGEGHRIVGISAYTLRPPEAKKNAPVVSAFIDGSVSKIKALKPDLIIGFSDIQAELAKSLIAENQQVLIFNQRTIQEILNVIGDVGRLVDRGHEAEALIAGYVTRLEAAKARSDARGRRPRVYFEEWDEPMISGIRWVSELIALAGGDDIFADRSGGALAKERFVDWETVRARDPEIMLASWCGKPFDEASVRARSGADEVTAVRLGQLHELPPEVILQPGPACLTDGLDLLERLLA